MPKSSKARNWLSQWRALLPWERGLLVRAAVLLPLIWLGLRLFSFKRMQSFAHSGTRPSCSPRLPAGQQAADYAQRCAELVAIAARHGFYRANCLPHSLVLCRILRKQGLEARLMIGVQPGQRPFQAHAWVELEEKPVGQLTDEWLPFAKPGLS